MKIKYIHETKITAIETLRSLVKGINIRQSFSLMSICIMYVTPLEDTNPRRNFSSNQKC